MDRPEILFLSQGRATAGTALGHVRVRHAVEAAPEPRARLAFAEVPPFSAAERALVRRVGGGGGALHQLRWHLVRSAAARRLLRDRLRTAPPAVVHLTTDQVGLLLGDVQRRVPVVLSLDSTMRDWLRLVEDVPAGAPTPAALRPVAALERRALERAPLTIAWTDTVAARVRALAPGARVATLHPGLDPSAFRPAAERPPGPARVLFVGGRWAGKGGPELLAALEPELGRDVELHVVTTDDVPRRDGVVVHAATPGSAALAERFRAADVLCLPTRVDAVPWVVLEALASAVPVVTSAIGSLPELAGDSGIAVAPGDVRALREALLALLGDPARRRAMGAAGRARVEARYDARRNGRELVGRLLAVAGAHEVGG